jgi:hypothetical protein
MQNIMKLIFRPDVGPDVELWRLSNINKKKFNDNNSLRTEAGSIT